MSDMEVPEELPEAPLFEQEAKVRLVPHVFDKLFRRAGDRRGLYLAETKDRFVISDGQQEVYLMLSLGVSVAVALIMCLLARGFDVWPLFLVAGLFTAVTVASAVFMRRISTTFDRRKRRITQEMTRACCFSRRVEYDLDDAKCFTRDGSGRLSIIAMELSSGEQVALTYPGWFDVDDLKTIGPNRMNNFLLRIRGQAGRKFPPSHVLARGNRDAEHPWELSIVQNDVIKVLENFGESGWWKGRLGTGEQGMFPVGWTVEMAPSDLAAAAIANANKME